MVSHARAFARHFRCQSRTLRILILSLALAAALAGFANVESDHARADGNCASHYPYKVTDGHGHDRDGDGVGCESNPRWPSGATSSSSSSHTCADHYPYKVTDGHGHDGDGDGIGCEANPLWPNGQSSSGVNTRTQSTGYDRDNWSYDSSAARARLGCTRDEHVDHIVALKEAYDSSGSGWSLQRKREFANDPLNQWCLAAGINISKSDGDLAEWNGGTCEQRKFIAQRTQLVKTKYGLSTDPTERRANAEALAADCALTTSATGAAPAVGSSSANPSQSTEARPSPTTASELFAALSGHGVRTLWRWNGSNWVGYAETEGDPIPGAFDFVIGPNDRLYIGN